MPTLKNLFNDKRGISNTVLATLVSMVVLTIYWGMLKVPGGAETLFNLLYLFLKAIGAVDENFSQFVEITQDTPVWALLTLIGSQAGMIIIVAVTFSGTWWAVNIINKVKIRRKARRGWRQEEAGERNQFRREGLKGVEGKLSGLLLKLTGAYKKPKQNNNTDQASE